MILALPPSTEYSRANTIGTRNILFANAIVKQILNIIEYLKPRFYFIINSQTSLLKDQYMMQSLNYEDVDCCEYGIQYRKRTRIWTNCNKWIPRALCCKDCGMIRNNKHIKIIPKNEDNNRNKQNELYKIPEQLWYEIFASINKCDVTEM